MQTSQLASDVYFPLEIVAREYAGHLLLAVEMVARGRVAVIGHKGAVQRTMAQAARPGLLFYKNADYPSWAAGVQHALVGLDPEAGIVVEDFADFFAARRVMAEGSLSLAQFCFGPDDHDFLNARFPDLSPRIHLTGAPRVGLWGRDGERFYAEDTARIRDHYGEVLLFASSGGFAHEHYLSLAGQDPDAAWAAREPAHHFFERVVAAAETFDRPVVVRPHPSDSWVAWRRAAADIPNLWVDTAFDLAAWTRAAIAVVHPGTSTAAFEAVCGGVPAISTESTPEDSNAAARVSHRTSTVDALLAALTAAQQGELPTLPDEKARHLLERKLLHPLEGATGRIADVLDEATPSDGASALPGRLSRLPRRPSFRLRRRRATAPELGRTDAPPFKRDPILIEKVERDVAAALEILGRRSAIEVRPQGPNCFVLSA